MSRLACFLTALWLSSAAAQPAVATDIKNNTTRAVRAGLFTVEKTLASAVNGACSRAKKVLKVTYEDYDDNEPDMSNLSLVFMTSEKNYTCNLTEAAEEFPKGSWFNPKLPLKIYLHGFTDGPTGDGFQAVSSAFFAQEANKGQMYILALDASSQIGAFYLRATTMVQYIGEKLGNTLAAFVDAGMDPQNFHLIGHSLGAHIAGFTGQTFSSLTNGSLVGRISGLDPAGPCFGKLNSTLKLSKGDAVFVDVIHTNAGVLGINEEVGDVDMWPNGGSEQMNCSSPTCSHSRAWRYFAESVLTPEAFIGVKCNSYDEFRQGLGDYNDTSVMGYGTPSNTSGSYCLQTLGEEPFAAGATGLTYKDT